MQNALKTHKLFRHRRSGLTTEEKRLIRVELMRRAEEEKKQWEAGQPPVEVAQPPPVVAQLPPGNPFTTATEGRSQPLVSCTPPVRGDDPRISAVEKVPEPDFEAMVLESCSCESPQYPHVKSQVQARMGRALTTAEKTAIRTCILNVASRTLLASSETERDTAAFTQELVLIISAAPVVWENQRWNMLCEPNYGSTYPGHLLQTDPLKWSNTTSHTSNTSNSQSMVRNELVPDVSGGAVWRVDKSVPRCDEDGWQYDDNAFFVYLEDITLLLIR